MVGVNDFTEGDDGEHELLRIDPALERKQIGRVQAVRARRDGAAVEAALAALRERPPTADANLMPLLLDCARAHATEGEIVARAPGRLGRLHRDAGVLEAVAPALAFDPIAEARRQWTRRWGDEVGALDARRHLDHARAADPDDAPQRARRAATT